MKTLFSGAAITLFISSVIISGTTIGLYCYNQLYSIHKQNITEGNVSDTTGKSIFVLINNADTTVRNKETFSFRSKTTITPPLPALDPVSQNIYLHANAGTTFISGNNTRITVPPFAFVDSNGNVIDAEIEMQYREFLRPYDIFLSGIPMQFDSNNILESQCLFELNASSYGKPVYINPQKPITMNFATTAFGSYKLYYFNSSSIWQEELNPNSVIRTQQTDYIRPMRSIVLPKYAIAFKCKTKMELRRESFFGKKHSPDHFIFTVQNFTDLFPELRELKNINWLCEGTNALDDYHMIFSPGQEDVYAEQIIYCDSASITHEGDIYLLEIKGRNRNTKLTITPYIVNAADELNFQLAYEAYRSARENRFSIEAQLANMFNDTTANTEISQHGDSILFTTGSPSFPISRFGIWSYAKLFTPQFPMHTNVIFVDEAGRKIEVNNGWMIMKNQNALIPVSDFENFGFSPFSKDFFWTVLSGGKIGIVYPEEFRRHQFNSEKLKFKMRVYEDFEAIGPKILKL